MKKNPHNSTFTIYAMRSILFIVFICTAFKTHAQSILQFDNGIVLEVTIKEFVAENHTLDTCYYKSQQYLCRIDGNEWFGMDHGMEIPTYELEEIVVIHKGEKTNLDVHQMYNPVLSTTISARHFTIKETNNQIEISAWFSDGAGTYCAKWLVEGGSSKRILLSSREEDCF